MRIDHIALFCSYYVCKALATNSAKKKREKEIICIFVGANIMSNKQNPNHAYE